MGAPGLGALFQDLVAAIGAVQASGLGQVRGPDVGDDIEEGDGFLPMFGKLVIRRDQGLEVTEIEPFGRHLIHQTGQFLGQTQGLVRRFGAAGDGADQARQLGLAPHAGQGRRKVQGTCFRSVTRGVQFVDLDVAQRR